DLFRRTATTGLLLAAAACGGPRRTPSGGVVPSTEQTLNELFNLSALYQRMGRLAAGGPMPFVGAIAYAGGRGDSTIARVGLSFDNHAFAFQRDGRAFSTRFRVRVSVVRPGRTPVQAERDEIVRVESFAETQRGEEIINGTQGL